MLERPPPDAKPMTPTDAYGAIVQQFRDVPQGQWHEIAAREVVRFDASGRLTQQQAAEVSSLLTQRLARMLERNPPIDPKRELGLSAGSCARSVTRNVVRLVWQSARSSMTPR